MDHKNLMFGDWVRSTVSGKAYQVLEAGDPFIMVDNPGGVWLRTIGMKHRIVEPIPLTEEILEKNGWEAFNGRYNIVRYRILTNEMALIIEPMKVESILGERWFWLSVNKRDGEVRPNMNYPFCYVHELQHALHLCGLNELVENLKVE